MPVLDIIKSLPCQCELTYAQLSFQFIENLDVAVESKRDWHRRAGLEIKTFLLMKNTHLKKKKQTTPSPHTELGQNV